MHLAVFPWTQPWLKIIQPCRKFQQKKKKKMGCLTPSLWNILRPSGWGRGEGRGWDSCLGNRKQNKDKRSLFPLTRVFLGHTSSSVATKRASLYLLQHDKSIGRGAGGDTGLVETKWAQENRKNQQKTKKVKKKKINKIKRNKIKNPKSKLIQLQNHITTW